MATHANKAERRELRERNARLTSRGFVPHIESKDFELTIHLPNSDSLSVLMDVMLEKMKEAKDGQSTSPIHMLEL